MSAMRDFWTNVVPEVSKANGVKLEAGSGAGVPEPVALAANPGDAPAGPPAATGKSAGPSSRPAVAKPAPRRERNDAELKQLAQWPGDAHRVWKSLTGTEQVALQAHMANRYGVDFAKKFVEFTKSGARDDWSTFGGPFPEYTPDWFEKRGYKLAQKDSVNQWWVHPSGHVMVGQFGAAGAKRAADIADQKAFDEALAKADRVVKAIEGMKKQVEDMQAWLTVHVETDPGYEGKFNKYVEGLEAIKHQVESALNGIDGVRKQLAPKGIDVTPINDFVSKLNEFKQWAEYWSDPARLALLEP
jgi:hypothetical protein